MSTQTMTTDRRRGHAGGGPDPAASNTIVRRLAAPMLTLMVVAACTTGAAPSPSGAPPSSSAGPSAASADFTLDVLPELFAGKAIGGQRVLLLVTVSGAAADGPVDIAATATATGAVVTVDQVRLSPGKVGEVTVVPPAVSAEQDLVVTITATRGAVTRTVVRTVGLFPGEDTNAEMAGQLLERFIPWLAANRPELGITTATTWQGTPGGWVLVVTHYLYLSNDWELDLAWHNMIPPDDWARINLRHRGYEAAPSVAFEINSMSTNGAPREIVPDAAVWR